MKTKIAKATTRHENIYRRRQLSAVDVAVASSEVCQRLLLYLAGESAQLVASYHAMNGEIITRPALVALEARGHALALPAVNDTGDMVFREYKNSDILEKDSLGIMSPSNTAKEVLPDIILMPLVAFDTAGGRIGHGGGYYDQKLADLHKNGHHPKLIGLAYDWQEVQPNIPLESHDVRLDIVITC